MSFPSFVVVVAVFLSPKDQFKSNVREAVHLRAGGKSRVLKYKTEVYTKKEMITDLVDRGSQFYELQAYIDKYGDPKKNKAKVVTKTLADGKKKKGVYVRTGPKGIWDVEVRARSSAGSKEQRHSGADVWDAGDCWAIQAAKSELGSGSRPQPYLSLRAS